MTYSSKKNIIAMAAGVLSITAYIVYINIGNVPAPEDIAAWAKLMLVFIGASIIGQIVIQILFQITFSISVALSENDMDSEKTKRTIRTLTMEDERDKLINLKALRIGYSCVGIGLLAALFALASGVSFIVALHIVVGIAALGSLIEGSISVFFHERGVRNG